VRAYYAHGAELASVVREQAWLGSLARAVLRPIVALARRLDGDPDHVR
jgi:hypothetical protein